MGGGDSVVTFTMVPYVPPAPGDFDGDVDLTDCAFFQTCFNGPNRSPAGPACGAADLDDDNDADLNDFMILQSCFSGPNQSPRC